MIVFFVQAPFRMTRKTGVYTRQLRRRKRKGVRLRMTRRGLVPRDVDEAQVARSNASELSGGVVAHMASIAVFFATVAVITQFYGSRTWRSMRYVAYARRQSILDRVVEHLAPNPRTILAFGANFYGRRCETGNPPTFVVFGRLWQCRVSQSDCWFVAGEKGRVPSRAIRRKLALHRRVVLVNEYNTSKKSCCHGADTVDAGYRLKRCSHPGCDQVWDRDVNGARNIRRCWEQHCTNGMRPAGLDWPDNCPWGNLDFVVRRVTWWNQLPNVEV